MKRFNAFVIAAAAGLMLAAACDEVQVPSADLSKGLTGDLSVSVNVPEAPVTKAITDGIGSDLSVSSIQLIAYGADGKLVRDFGYKTAAAEITPDASGKVTVTAVDLPADNSATGKPYQLAVLVNYPKLEDQLAGSTNPNPVKMNLDNAAAGSPAAPADKSLKYMQVGLKDIFLDKTVSKGILRFGTGSASVKPSPATNSGAVTALPVPFRAVIKEIDVELYDQSATLAVTGVFLENVMSVWDLGRNADPSVPVNLAGRVSGKSGSTSKADFIDAKADIPVDIQNMTWRDIAWSASAVHKETYTAANAPAVYGLPNATLKAADQFSGPIASGAALTRVVVVGTYTSNGTSEVCYYPVTIWDAASSVGPEAGKSYDVKLKIRNKGSLDPNDEPKYGSLSIDITINGWTGGSDLNGNF